MASIAKMTSAEAEGCANAQVEARNVKMIGAIARAGVPKSRGFLPFDSEAVTAALKVSPGMTKIPRTLEE